MLSNLKLCNRDINILSKSYHDLTCNIIQVYEDKFVRNNTIMYIVYQQVPMSYIINFNFTQVIIINNEFLIEMLVMKTYSISKKNTNVCQYAFFTFVVGTKVCQFS